MVDINIVAKGNLASLISLEAERLSVTYKVTASPIKNAGLYIVDFEFYNGDRFDKEKTVALNSSKADCFAYSLSWPFLLSEFRKNVRALLFGKERSEEKKDLQIGTVKAEISLNPKNRCAVIGNREISLSPAEYLIFDALLKRRGEILTHDELNQLTDGGRSNKINVHICFLRKKLEADGTKIIYSVRGKGFFIK